MSKTNEEIVEDVVVICDGLYTGKTGKVLGVGSSPHSIKLLVDSNERYEPDYALLTITKENKRAVELLLSHYTTLEAKDKECEERLREERKDAYEHAEIVRQRLLNDIRQAIEEDEPYGGAKERVFSILDALTPTKTDKQD